MKKCAILGFNVRLTDIKKGRKFEVPTAFEIDQGGRRFRPHVSIVQVGKPFVLLRFNSVSDMG